ncbi:hypothetical protein PCASD_14502 [Puccinia coronata f. sp. avenae]|uniref:Mitochondrial intermembrane space import and assembly protein 40 n=1 Tax=Puccinia coronata f. sp. avenae TaxID=200324 RepID=A0A2N5TEY2_9BASI|nr:hypothetical protein PCASD_14502 [Puccinia coronata f. sp. avenae]
MSRPFLMRGSACLLTNPARCSPRSLRRPVSSTSSPPTGNHSPSSRNTSTDRAIVLGLLTIITSLGVGIGTRAKSLNTRSAEIIKSSPDPQNQIQAETEKPADHEPEPSAENSQQGAFNPDTGEINWDCPCLGGMAHGTCGEQFKAAFSCFVYSEQEPKGVECIERFKEMQDCFKEHPEEYGPELVDGDDSTTDDDVPHSPDGIDSTEGLIEPAQQNEGEERPLAARSLTMHASDSPARKDAEEEGLVNASSRSQSPPPTAPFTPSAAPDTTPARPSPPPSSKSKSLPKTD